MKKSKLADLYIVMRVDFTDGLSTDEVAIRERQEFERHITDFMTRHTDSGIRKFGEFVYSKYGCSLKITLLNKSSRRIAKTLETESIHTDQFVARFDSVTKLPAWRSKPRSPKSPQAAADPTTRATPRRRNDIRV